MPTAPPLTVRIAQPAERRAALELVLTPLAPSARGPLLDSFATAPPHRLGPFDGLAVAIDPAGQVQAACWAQPAPGSAVGIWPTEWAGARPGWALEVETRLTDAAVQVCDDSQTAMAQSLFERAEDARAEGLMACGFVRLAELIYLGRSVRGTKPAGDSKNGLFFEPYRPSEHARLKRILKQTYVDSLDCPGIDELRDLDDVLLGYQSTGQHDPEHWRFIVSESTDVGVLLLTEHPAADQAELIYLGLSPGARGRGWGKAILGEALAIAGRMGVDQLMAAVDAANTPARRAYERAGYAPWAQRHVLVRRHGGGPIARN